MTGMATTDLLNLIVEIKGIAARTPRKRRTTMDTYWVPGVNNLGTFGRWAFAEFTEVYRDRTGLQCEGAKRVQEDGRLRDHGRAGAS